MWLAYVCHHVNHQMHQIFHVLAFTVRMCSLLSVKVSFSLSVGSFSHFLQRFCTPTNMKCHQLQCTLHPSNPQTLHYKAVAGAFETISVFQVINLEEAPRSQRQRWSEVVLGNTA